MQLTFEGKNKEFLKSFKITDVMNVPKNKMADMRNTFGTGSGLIQSGPMSVPFRACQTNQKMVKIFKFNCYYLCGSPDIDSSSIWPIRNSIHYCLLAMCKCNHRLRPVLLSGNSIQSIMYFRLPANN